MSNRSNTKYGDRIEDHDWSDPDDSEDAPDRTRIGSHDIEVIYTTDPSESMGYGREKYTARIAYDDADGTPYVLFAIKHRWKGNYWRDTHDLDWRDVPQPVREQVAAALPVPDAAALDTDARLIEEGGESRWQKHHKHRVENLDSGEMWGASFLGDALDSAETAAEAVRERDLDAEPVEQAVEEIQRAITVLNEVTDDE